MLWNAHFRLRVEIFSKTRRAWTCIFYKTGTYLYFLFLFFFEDWCCCLALCGGVLMKTTIKHPQAPQKIISVTVVEIIIFRGAQWRGCGNRTATAGRERNVVYGVEWSTASVKRRGKYKKQPIGVPWFRAKWRFSRNGANPNGRAKEQPLKQ